MGKLHTLRRAIQRNPENFIWEVKTLRGETIKYVCTAARVETGKLIGRWGGSGKYWWTHSYRNFVYKVLKELGYKDIYRW